MRFLTAGEILTVQDLKREDVSVPEWGGDAAVHVQELSLADRVVWLNESIELTGTNGAAPRPKQRPEAGALLLTMTIVDEQGNPIFDSADVKALMRKSPRAADRIITVALRLSGMGAQAVDDAEKNSAGIPSADSSFVSH